MTFSITLPPALFAFVFDAPQLPLGTSRSNGRCGSSDDVVAEGPGSSASSHCWVCRGGDLVREEVGQPRRTASVPMAEDASIQLLSDGGLTVLNEPFKVFLTCKNIFFFPVKASSQMRRSADITKPVHINSLLSQRSIVCACRRRQGHMLKSSDTALIY